MNIPVNKFEVETVWNISTTHISYADAQTLDELLKEDNGPAEIGGFKNAYGYMLHRSQMEHYPETVRNLFKMCTASWILLDADGPTLEIPGFNLHNWDSGRTYNHEGTLIQSEDTKN